MENYKYQNALVDKKQLKHLLAWSFNKYNSMQACSLADELKYLGFNYATQSGISISIEDLRVPFIKGEMLKSANSAIRTDEINYLNGKLTLVEKIQRTITLWNSTSESLKGEVVSYFKKYDPLNSVYIMAFSGARGNLAQVRQLVGMRGLMAGPSGEVLDLAIKKNFKEGLTVTDYLISGYGARKGIIDTALKTANSGYLTRRLIDVAQDTIIREKDCRTPYSYLISKFKGNREVIKSIYEKILGRVLNKTVYHPKTNKIIANRGTQITPYLLDIFKKLSIDIFYIRSPLTCTLYRSICQKCYGWDLASQNLVDIGDAVGIIAGQSIGEPGTQLTMRTFHTGGVGIIKSSKLLQPIFSPGTGILKFPKQSPGINLRTNDGREILLVKMCSFLLIFKAGEKPGKLMKFQILPNTILFIKNNQYIRTGDIIGQSLITQKQVKKVVKPVLSLTSGEVLIPTFNSKLLFSNNFINNFFWVFAGQFYEVPTNSFLNFYPDHKVNKNNSIFRVKLINQSTGFINSLNQEPEIFRKVLKIFSKRYFLKDSKIQTVKFANGLKQVILIQDKNLYYLTFKLNNSKKLNQQLNQNLIVSLTNAFKTKTGGRAYYDQRLLNKATLNHKIIHFSPRSFLNNSENQIKINFIYNSLLWLTEETYTLNCDKSMLLIKHGSFINKNSQLIPGLFSKQAGIVSINQSNNLVKEIIIKPGLVYKCDKLRNFKEKIFYPGEIIFQTIKIKYLSLCQFIKGENGNHLLIRPLDIYEVPNQQRIKNIFEKSTEIGSVKILKSYNKYLPRSSEVIKTDRSVNLILNFQDSNLQKLNNLQFNINHHNNDEIEIFTNEEYDFTNHLTPHLRYTNLNVSTLVQKNQFVDSHTILGYFQKKTLNPLEIIKIKSRYYPDFRKILIISNNDCSIIEKRKLKSKSLKKSISKNIYANKAGKIILNNDRYLILQNGQRYLFGKSRVEKLANTTLELSKDLFLKYTILASHSVDDFNIFKMKKSICLNYYDLTKGRLINDSYFNENQKVSKGVKITFSKMWISKTHKIYSSPIPIFVQNFKIASIKKSPINFLSINNETIFKDTKSQKLIKNYPMFIKNSRLVSNNLKQNESFDLTRVQFFGYPFSKHTKIHSLTDDYTYKENNIIFCKNGQFIPNGYNLGLLSIQKEITGDIVQGLPRIEQLLEARKLKKAGQRTPINMKQGLLVQKTGLNNEFELKKIGSPLKKDDYINPHKLLKIYFNYYSNSKKFFCDRKQVVKNSCRLTKTIYESSYRSLKKVQSLILNSVQSIYKSQGVSINDKHLEVIIKQMTTKVLISYQGDSPLLPREVIDLYHIKQINEILTIHNKKTSVYVPVVLGISKAALNNPSFISAASFQETTRVLTKAAIEGRVDWLRGLKENIIIGHLIPAGTGSPDLTNSFTKKPTTLSKVKNLNFSTFINAE